jgi:Xaa-Pro dipeptidase
LFGINEPDCYAALDLGTGKPTFFVPQTSNLYKIWMTVLTKDDFKAKYEISDVVFVEDMAQWLKDRNAD